MQRRYRLLEGERLEQAIALYSSGQSLLTVGKQLGVSLETVRYALRQAGVEIRSRPGWSYR